MSADHPQSDLHLIIPTHTTRHLDLCLVGVALQVLPPTTITVTSDVDDPAIEDLLKTQATELNLSIGYVRRPHEGKERLAQVRNNAIRFLQSRDFNSGRLLFLDGDTYPSSNCLAQHARLGNLAEMVLPGRINLTEEQTAALDYENLRTGAQEIPTTIIQRAELSRLHRRGNLHQFLRPFGLTKSHKPKLLGGHHSVAWETYKKVNGHDEEYHTWGTEDDDFARRAYRSGARSIVAVRDIPVYHLYHPTRGSTDWQDRPNARRFATADLPTACQHGLQNPWPQAEIQTDIFDP